MTDRSRLFKIILSTIILATIVAAIVVSLRVFNKQAVPFDSLLDSVISLPYILAIPMVTGINLLLRYFRWVFLLRTFNFFAPSRALFVTYLAGFVGNLVPFFLPYLIRLLPLRGGFLNALPVLILDLLMDALALFTIFYFSPTNVLTLVPFIALIYFFVIASFPSKGRGKESYFFHKTFSVLFALYYSVITWAFTSLSIWLALKGYDQQISLLSAVKVYSAAHLKGAASLIPGGVLTTGMAMIESLSAMGVASDISLYSVTVLRLFTYWLSICLSMFASYYYLRSSKRLLSSDKHFDDIALQYRARIPEHMRVVYLQRKMNINLEYLPRDRFKKGLDIGCGQGWYLKEMLKHGYDVLGLDCSQNQVEQAKLFLGEAVSHRVCAGNITRIPFPEESQDFVYTINTIHHLESFEQQKLAFQEVWRILRPGGRFIVHEMNVQNPIFRFYMSYIFPLLKDIDQGIEIWMKHDEFGLYHDYKVINIIHNTFFPDFMPDGIMKALLTLEQKAVNIHILKRYAAHISFVLEK